MTLEGLISWVRRRLTPGQYFGLELTLGVVIFLSAAWIFGGLAEDVASRAPITRVDQNLARWMNLHQVTSIRDLMVLSVFSTLGRSASRRRIPGTSDVATRLALDHRR